MAVTTAFFVLPIPARGGFMGLTGANPGRFVGFGRTPPPSETDTPKKVMAFRD